jgi:hypothetical protein
MLPIAWKLWFQLNTSPIIVWGEFLARIVCTLGMSAASDTPIIRRRAPSCQMLWTKAMGAKTSMEKSKAGKQYPVRSHAIAQTAEQGCGEQSGDAVDGLDHASCQRDVTVAAHEHADVEAQDRFDGIVGCLDDHRGDEHAHDDGPVGQRGEEPCRLPAGLADGRGEVLVHAEDDEEQ